MISSLKELNKKFSSLYNFKETDSNFSIDIEKNNVYLNIKYTELTYLITISFSYSKEVEKGGNIPVNEVRKFEGAISPITIYFLEVLAECLTLVPYTFISSFFQSEFKETDLSKLIERLVYSRLEFDYFVNKVLKLEAWNGDEIVIPTKNSKISVCIDNKTGVPFLNVNFKKGADVISFSRAYTLFDFLLDFYNDYSWIESEEMVVSPKSLSKLDSSIVSSFSKLLHYFQVDITPETIMYKKHQIPIENKSLIYLDFSINDFGVVMRFFTKKRPYKPFLVKLPFRDDLEFNYDILRAFLYVIVNDRDGSFVSNCFDFFKEIDTFHMNLFVGFVKEIK